MIKSLKRIGENYFPKLDCLFINFTGSHVIDSDCFPAEIQFNINSADYLPKLFISHLTELSLG